MTWETIKCGAPKFAKRTTEWPQVYFEVKDFKPKRQDVSYFGFEDQNDFWTLKDKVDVLNEMSLQTKLLFTIKQTKAFKCTVG